MYKLLKFIMVLTYNVTYTGEHVHQLVNWCSVSCNLYNQTLYQIKQTLDSGSKLPSGYELISIMLTVPNLEGTFNYKLLKDICHKVTRKVVNLLKQNNIGHLTVGYNRGWKDNIRIGKRNNQVFCSIPYWTIVLMLLYKCQLEGIQFETVTEEYTSKCDALSSEPVGKKEVYKGVRVKRGLYQSGTKKLINADINGALNILRSRHCSVNVVDDSDWSRIINSGWLYQPVKCRNIFNKE